MHTPEFECPACGSRKVELRNSPPNASLAEKLRNLARPGQLGGRKYLVCKNCGHTQMINIL